MTTFVYGASPSDVVTDTAGNVLAGVELEVYATASALTPLNGLKQRTGQGDQPVYRLKTDDQGRYQFTCDTGPTVWLKTASSAQRWRIEAWQTTSEKLADLLNIKTVTRTLTPGSTANVQVAATANDLTFNFAIPTGTQGPRGLKGEPGKDGPSEDAIATYFRRAASQPMQALAELGVPRPYASKTAIDATRGGSVGELAKDTSSGATYAWNGSQWKMWDSPVGATALNVSLAGGITTYEGGPFYTVRSGMCTVLINFYKSGGFSTAARTRQTVFTGLPSNLRPAWIIPATFSTDIGVIVHGSLNPNGTFGVDHISDSSAWVRAIMTWPTI